MSETNERISDVVEKAQEAFWSVVAGEFPEITTGYFSPDASFDFSDACELAIERWVRQNEPSFK